MNEIFRPYLRRFILVFFNDILVYSKSWDDHLQQLRLTMQVLRTERFYVKPSKCCFGRRQVEYLGHWISGEGVRVDASKIQAMVDWARPTTVRALRGFLGLTGYYRKFVRNYGSIARPLINLLKNGDLSGVRGQRRRSMN